MQIIDKNDHSVAKLDGLKPNLSDPVSGDQKKFNDLLTSSMKTGYPVTDEKPKAELYTNDKLENKIPGWVNLDYGYDPQNPRKPNMREMIEAISGKKMEELHKEPEAMWQRVNQQASEILYGVIGSNEDTRDWNSIMESENIVKAAQEQTGAMYKPTVEILSSFDENKTLTEQIAVIKDKTGKTLRPLTNDLPLTAETLFNFGATRDSVPTNIEERIDPKKFDNDLLAFLKNFGNNATSVQQIIVQSASEAISNKISKEIPLDELAKL